MERTAFLAAISKGDIEGVKKISRGVAFKGPCPLQLACVKGYDEIADFLIELGARISKEAFFHASRNGLLAVTAKMMTRSPEIGSWALWNACILGQKEISETLINAGAHLSRTVDSESLLLVMCKKGDVDIVKILINAGSNVKKANESGNFPLLAACEEDVAVEIIKLLINAGSPVNKGDESGYIPLLAACEKGDSSEIVKLLINAGSDVNKVDQLGRSPLMAACIAKDFETIRILIKAGARVNKADECGRFPLLEACEKGFRVEIINLLIKAGSNVNNSGRAGRYPLLAACENDDVETVQVLINAGSHVNKTDEDGFFPLLQACEMRAPVEIIRLLIKAGSNVNKSGRFGRYPLLAAREKGYTEAIQVLIKAGSHVNEEDKRALLVAAFEKGKLEIIRTLLNAGLNVFAAEGYAKILFLAALERNDVDGAKLLFFSGAEFNDLLKLFCYNDFASEADDAEARRISVDRHEIIGFLINNVTFFCNDADYYGRVLLQAASEMGDVQLGQFLINAGVDVEKTFDAEKAPLLVACEKGDAAFVKLLINTGLDVNKADRNGKVALFAAFEKGDIEIVELLFAAGAKATETERVVLLVKVCTLGHYVLADLLLKMGCTPNARDSEGKTALFYSCLHGHYSIAVLLMKSSENIDFDFEKSILPIIVKNHQYSSEISKDALDLVKPMLVRSPSITSVRTTEGHLLHELPIPAELKNILFGFWVQYQFRELYAQGKTKPSQLKVCVIGQARAGKTTLIKSLRDIDWQVGVDDQRTASVDVTVATIKLAGELVFCDFAGQPFFHKTHGLFFSASSTIFVLVVDLTTDEKELITTSHYWASFVKCSVFLAGKAHFLVIGSKKDQLSDLDIAQTKLKNLLVHLQATFRQWFEFFGNAFVLNCRERSSKELLEFQQSLSEVKRFTVETANEVPSIVETARKVFLSILRNPSVSPTTFDKFKLAFSSKLSNYRLAQDLRRNTISVLKSTDLIPRDGEEGEFTCLHFIPSDVFKRLMVQSVCAGLSDEVQSLLVDYLQAIGEILVIDNTVILDPPWLCHNVVGPLLSPREFSVHLDRTASGTASKDKIQSVLEIFNPPKKWENVEATISLLCRLEICYPFSDQTDTYQFPALIEEKRPTYVWREKPEMTVYVGRRLMSEDETDIITPGTMPFIQSSVRNAQCFCPSTPVVWQGGLFVDRTVGQHFVEGMILFQDHEKAIDFIVRGPEHSELQCKIHLKDLMNVGMGVLRVKSPGTIQTLWYISPTELKQLKAFPVGYRAETVDEMKKSMYSNAYVSQGDVKDTLKNLLALPDDHFLFVPFKARGIICKCLEKDSEGKKELSNRLPNFSSLDRLSSDSAEKILSLWCNNLEATTNRFADVARASGLLYLLVILNDCGALELSDNEEKAAREDLTFFEENCPTAIAARRRTRLEVDGSTCCTEASGEVASTEMTSDSYLDVKVTPKERIEVARRIPAEWRRIGLILGPEPTFKEYDLDECEQGRQGRDCAQEMLRKWAEKYDNEATRRHLIDAMIKEELKARASEVFQMS